MRRHYDLAARPYQYFPWLAEEARVHMRHRSEEGIAGRDDRPRHSGSIGGPTGGPSR